MALLFPRVIKSCTFKMTWNSCSPRQKKTPLKRDTKGTGVLDVRFITTKLKGHKYKRRLITSKRAGGKSVAKTTHTF